MIDTLWELIPEDRIINLLAMMIFVLNFLAAHFGWSGKYTDEVNSFSDWVVYFFKDSPLHYSTYSLRIFDKVHFDEKGPWPALILGSTGTVLGLIYLIMFPPTDTDISLYVLTPIVIITLAGMCYRLGSVAGEARNLIDKIIDDLQETPETSINERLFWVFLVWFIICSTGFLLGDIKTAIIYSFIFILLGCVEIISWWLKNYF